MLNSQKELGITENDKVLRLPVFNENVEQGSPKLGQLAKEQWKYECQARRDAYHINLESKGFLIHRDYLVLDLAGLYQKNKSRMQKYRDVLLRVAHKHQLNEWEFCKLVLSFVQQIKYEIPSDFRGGLYTGGIYTPPEVLILEKGDCDSKSLLLSTLLMSERTEVILLDGPRHVLVGIEGYPRKQDYYVQLDGKYFILCEASNGPWFPGKIAKEIVCEFHNKDYEFIRLN